MADKSSQLILEALSRAAADPDGVPLHGTKAAPGLFPANAAGKDAAQRCQDEGYLRAAATDDAAASRGDTGATATLVKKKAVAAPLCTITEKGMTFLLAQVSPRQVLEDFVRALDGRRKQADDLVQAARQMHQGLEATRGNVDRILAHICQSETSALKGGAPGGLRAMLAGFHHENGPCRNGQAETTTAGVDEHLLAELTRWHQTGASEDYPLPQLFRQLVSHSPDATIGQFHDGLRRLHDRGRVYLHPWTGPLYAIPEPPYVLLVGHEIAYYASLREQGAGKGE